MQSLNPGVSPHVLEYLNTPDLIRVSRLNKQTNEWIRTTFAFLKLRDGQSQCVVSTNHHDSTFIHTLFESMADLGSFLSLMRRSGISIPHTMYVTLNPLHDNSNRIPQGYFYRLKQVLECPNDFYHFASENRFLCQFRFTDIQESPENTIYSNSIDIPGGTVKLFLRPLPTFNSESTHSSVIGIKLESDRVWILRVASVSESKKRIELKAGCTKADVLRVPNGGRGTWSDLLPIESHLWDNDNIFLLEFI